LLLGHRGARPVRRLGFSWSGSKVPAENTLAAFEYALAQGCDGFEFDVRYTRDRRHVLCHDPKLHQREIATGDYSDLHRHPERRKAPIACLEDVLRTLGDRAYLDIELKVAGCEEQIVAQLKAHPPSRGYVVSSFLPDVLLRLNELDDTMPLGYICKDAEAAEAWSMLPIRVLLPHYRLVSRRLVDEVHRRKMQLVTWTVNRESDMLRFASWEVDGLISDDPQLLHRTFRRAEGSESAARMD
jgi:glycerophosphoryl diester phosphodiesterase